MLWNLLQTNPLLSPEAELLKNHTSSPYANISQVKYQHGLKSQHSTTTALHKLTNQITQGFNQKQLPHRSIVVSLDLSKAFDTVNIHSLINKLHQSMVPDTIIKFISNYIKGRKGYCEYKKHRSKSQKFKTGVPQGGVLSPTLFNLYTSDLLLPTEGVSITTYANTVYGRSRDRRKIGLRRGITQYPINGESPEPTLNS